MNYQFAPFRVGVSDVTPEELAKAKAKINTAWSALKTAVVDLSLAAADVSLYHTSNVLYDTAGGLKQIAKKVQTWHCQVSAIRCDRDQATPQEEFVGEPQLKK